MSLDVEESTRRPCEGRRVSSCLWRVCATTEGASPGLQTAAGPDRRHTALPPNRDNLAKIPYAMEATTPHHAAPSDTPVLNIFSRMTMILYYSLCLLPTWPVCVPEQLWPPVPVLLQSRVLFLGRGRRFVLLTRQRARADRRARSAQVQTGHSQLSNGGNLARLGGQQQQRVVKHGQTRQQRGVRRAFLLRLHASHRSGAELSLSSTNALPATHTTQKQNDESEGQLGSCRTLGDLSSLNSIVGFIGCIYMYTWQA